MTTNHKRLFLASSVLLFVYIGLALSTAHVDAGSVRRQDAANVVGTVLIVVAIIGSIIYAPRYLAQQAQQAATEVLKETPEQRAQHAAHETRSVRVKAIGLGVFIVAAAIYPCFFTPDARYSRVRASIERLEGHQPEEIASLVEGGRDLESARFLVAMRLKRLEAEAEKLWPETKAARKAAAQLPRRVLEP